MYERGIRANPFHVRCRYYLGQYYERFKKDHGKAAECYLHAIELNPRHTNSLKDYGNLMVKSRQHAKVWVVSPRFLHVCMDAAPCFEVLWFMNEGTTPIVYRQGSTLSKHSRWIRYIHGR
jgi:hypothetical protein